MKSAVVILIAALLNSELAQAQMVAPQPVMTNSTVEAMVRGGVSVATIVDAIKAAPEADFLINNYEVGLLIRAGASDRSSDQIMEAMRQRLTRGRVQSIPAPVIVPVGVVASVPAVAPAPPVAPEPVVAPAPAVPLARAVAPAAAPLPPPTPEPRVTSNPISNWVPSGNGHKVTYDGGSIPDAKVGAGMKLYLDSAGIRLTKDRTDVVSIPSSAVTEISYGQDVHRRIGAAIGLAFVSLGVGALMALTKSKKHHVGLTWDDGGKKGGVAFQADKSDCRGLIAGLEGVTGKKAVNSDALTVKN